MKVFLSWSGPQSLAAAYALRDWLPYVINAAEPWMSAADIEVGTRWSVAIQNELESTRFGILLVTQANVNSPWLLFEAGALAKTLHDTYVCPFLIGLKPVDLPAGPLAQFQAKIADKAGTAQLLETLNDAMKTEAMPKSRLEHAFQKWWPELEDKLRHLPAETMAIEAPRTMEEVLDELLTITRRLDRAVPAIVSRQKDSETPCDELFRSAVHSALHHPPQKQAMSEYDVWRNSPKALQAQLERREQKSEEAGESNSKDS